MENHKDEIESLRTEIKHYKRRVEELAGECMKYDTALWKARHELLQKRLGFSLLSDLHQTAGVHTEISSILGITLQAVFATLGTDRTVFLTPTDEKHCYQPSQWLGFRHEADEKLSSLTIEFPPDFTEGSGLLVVNRSTEETPLIKEIRDAFDLPYFICLPVMVDDEPLGLLLSGKLYEAMPFSAPLDEGDVETFRYIAGFISASVHHRRIIMLKAHVERQEAELRFAAQIQKNLLPRSDPEVKGYDIAGLSVPALSVGGDYYDFIIYDDENLAVCLGDICGKGMPAALLMSNLQATVRSQVMVGRSPRECAARANDILFQNTDKDQYSTFFYGQLNTATNEFCFTNAGHNPPMLFHDGTQSELLYSGGTVLGFMDDSEYIERTITFSPGDVLVIYSDGVTEAMDTSENEFGEDNLEELIKANLHLPSSMIIDTIFSSVNEHSKDVTQSDDITLVVIKKI